MSKPIEYIINFPQGFPSAYSGIILSDNRTLITGHVNGIVAKWEFGKETHEILFKSDTIVQTISNFADQKIALGYNSGGLYVYYLKTKKVVEIQKPTHHRNQRVWKTKWIDENKLVMTSTYGEVRLINFTSEDAWTEHQLRWHSHAIFALSNYDSRILTGDWNGNIIIWDIEKEKYSAKERIRIFGTIQGLYWYSEKCIVAINKNGKLFLIEKNDSDNLWQISTEIDVARDRGNCVILTHDGEIIYAGTNSEIIQIDISTNQIKKMELQSVKELFIDESEMYALTSYALIKFDKERAEIPENIISYKFKKVSLLGHTGTGKSTFCNLLATGKVEEIYSTYGKRVWNLPPVKIRGNDTRIILHDHGGQETVLDTFLPFLNDSDIFLLFYSQIDKITFNRAYELLMELRNTVGNNIEIYFVQTFIDHSLDEVPYGVVNELIDKGIINDIIKISPYKKDLKEYEEKLVNTINWDESKIMISSPFIEGINETINELRLKEISTISFNEFKANYQNIIDQNISDGHLKFLLNDATNEGKIEYYPDILDIIILNDDEFNKMRTEIPIIVDHNDGIIVMSKLEEKYENKEYFRILDEIYTNSNISYKFGDKRIFPHKLKEINIDIPEFYRENLQKVDEETLIVDYKSINISQLLEMFSEMRLQCIDLSKKDGLLTWSDNAYIYYYLQERGGGLSGKKIVFTYYVAGSKPETIIRLSTSFSALVNRLYGPIIVEEQEQENKKKETLEFYEFDVALSFAGEQREFVEKVANLLSSKGIIVFYDEFYQSQLWGKNLVEYFKEVYYSKSKYCIMFISKEYLEKMWPTHERKNATARDIEKFGEYILPVVFERDLDVPGLDRYRGYLGVWKYSAEDVTDIFLKKLESE